MSYQKIVDNVVNYDLSSQLGKGLVNALAAIGALYIASYLKVPVSGFYKHFLRPRRNLTRRYGSNWALVTGAGDGIGKAYCHQLAKSGYNIILLSRTLENLEKVASELQSQHGVQTKIIQFDLNSLNNEESVKKLYSLLDSIKEDVSILANNAGKAHVNPVHKHSIEVLFNMVNVNVNAQIFMSRYFLERFQKRFDQNGKRSAIINVSSVGALSPSKNGVPYCATKAFNQVFSNGTALDYPFVDVLTVCPMSTRSSMNSGIYVGTIEASSHAKAVIDQLGWETQTLGHWYHGLNYSLLKFWPTYTIIGSINASRRLQFMKRRDEEAAKKQTLYERLGGAAAINAVVDGMYAKIFTDPELIDFFRKTDKEHQKEMQRKFLTYATGGSTEWTGKNMKDAHKGRGIRGHEFDLVAGHVISTMKELGVPQNLQDEVVALLVPLKPDCIDEEEEEQKQAPKTLYERLGGAGAINAVVDGMYAKIFTDPELIDFFRKTDKEHQKEMQRQFLTYATGGSKEWHGKDMKSAHKGRGIRGHEFDLVAGHVISTMKELGVPQNLQDEVVALLVPLKPDCVDEDEEPKKTLYERIGGAPAINAVVDGMYAKIFTDPELIDFFRKTDKEHQKEMQRQFLTYATGGSSEWHGKDMKSAHKGRGIRGHEFDLVAGHVVSTMKELGVPQNLQDEVVALLVPLKGDCIDEE